MANSRHSAISPELIAHIRRLHFESNKLADETISGQYRSAFRGRGIEFEEVREYSPGDDVRAIDWKVTARSRKPQIKVYREERELTVMLAVDVSASTMGGTRGQTKENLIAQLGAVLTFIALKNNDKVGLLTFSDCIENYHPPRKARGSAWRILHEVLQSGEYSSGTDFPETINFLNQVLKRHSIVFLISDFILPREQLEDKAKNPLHAALSRLSRKHDVTAIVTRDPFEYQLPSVGLLQIRDPETGVEALLDTSDQGVRKAFERQELERQSLLQSLLRKYRISSLELRTDKSFHHKLRSYFRQRGRRRLH